MAVGWGVLGHEGADLVISLLMSVKLQLASYL